MIVDTVDCVIVGSMSWNTLATLNLTFGIGSLLAVSTSAGMSVESTQSCFMCGMSAAIVWSPVIL